ncbi:hypothetical protein T484DRAFT_1893818, partial [Baffinella frigidus]
MKFDWGVLFAAGFVVIDDDEDGDFGVPGTLHVEEGDMHWPELPAAPARPPEVRVEPVTKPRVPAPPPGPPPATSTVSAGADLLWTWSPPAAAILASIAASGARTILERQMGGIAKDQAFAEEAAMVDREMLAMFSDGTSLEEQGFTVVKVQVVRSAGLVQGFERRLETLAGRRAERNGWQYVPLHSDVTPRPGYWWDETSGESRWHVPEPSHLPSTSGRDLENKAVGNKVVGNKAVGNNGVAGEEGERWGGRAFGQARGFAVKGVWTVWDGSVPRRVDSGFLLK